MRADATASVSGPRGTFVGAGAIGLPMALQIQRAGLAVTGVDVSDRVIAIAKASGIETVRSLIAAPSADMVVVMFAIPEQREQGEQGEILRRAGALVVDAPVTGGVARAKAGALVIFAAGAPEDVSAAMTALAAMGTVHVTGVKPRRRAEHQGGQPAPVLGAHCRGLPKP